MTDQVVPESWYIPRALSNEALRLLTSLPMDEIERRLRMDGPAVPEGREPAAVEGQPSDGWLPIDTAPREGTEILAGAYDAIEIVSWRLRLGWHGWYNRDDRLMLPSWWQPLPEHPPLPEAQ